ncbi:MAG: hypothetical protein K5756_07610 [Clostridiales bacterium]|nr:hypothetical protein [Clostridiales bacterium]
MRTVKKTVALIVAFTLLLMTFSASMSVSATPNYGNVEGITVVGRYVIHSGDVLKISDIYRNENVTRTIVELINKYDNTVTVEPDTAAPDAFKIVAKNNACGVNLISVCEYYERYGLTSYDHYCIIVVVESDSVKVKDMNLILEVNVPDLKMNYKGKAVPKANITTEISGMDLCCCQFYFVNSDNGKVYIDDNGYIVAGETGSFEGRYYAIDAMGRVHSEKFGIDVQYSWIQWIIRILFFGWLWY